MSVRSFLLPGSFFILILLFWGGNHFLLLARVEENSMDPTLENGQWIVVKKQYRDFQEGDILVFPNPDSGQLLVKRCFLLQGDPLRIVEPWLKTTRGDYYLTRSQLAFLSQYKTVPENSLLMLGDNAFHSIDSRDFGFIACEEILGKVAGSYE